MIGSFLRTAEQAVQRIAAPETERAWTAPSALPGMTVGGLAGHLANQILSVRPTLAEPVAQGAEPISALDHYKRAVWVGAPRDSEANAGILARAEERCAAGPSATAAEAREELAALRAELGSERPAADRVVFVPQTGWALTLDGFLTTRLLELIVHLDDLAASLGGEPAPVDDEAYDAVLTLLARLAAHRHGQSAVLSTLTRAERAGTVTAL
jgi:hypothetical protein